jgi:glycine/D-amino acid oxidase-like deaminating enzyme
MSSSLALRLEPFWTEDYPRPPDLPVSPLPDQADVAIIGSGYTGLHAARTLARHGAQVVVLEQETIGWGASSRNGGMLNTGLKESMPVIFRRYGPEHGRRLWQWSLAAIDHVEQTIDEERIACDFARTGQVVLAYKSAHFTALRQEVAWQHANLDDHEPVILGPEDLCAEVGGDSYYGGVLDGRGAAIHPACYVFGLARAAACHGAVLVEHAQVRAVTRTATGFRVQSTSGELQAKDVLLATNGYTNNAIPAARRGIFPVGSYIITTPPLPLSLRSALLPTGRMCYDSKHFLNYFRLTPDGRMLFGGRHNLSPSLDLHESAAALRRRMLEVFPQLTGTDITHSWTGKLGVTFDLMPHIGRIPGGRARGVLYAYGYAGHGVAAASLMGHQAGQLLAGVATDNPFLELRHPRYFFTPYDRAYLPLVSTWFRFLDAIG